MGVGRKAAEKEHMLTAFLPHTEFLMTQLHLAKGKNIPKIWSWRGGRGEVRRYSLFQSRGHLKRLCSVLACPTPSSPKTGAGKPEIRDPTILPRFKQLTTPFLKRGRRRKKAMGF